MTPCTVCSSPGSSVHGILQAGILAWGAIPFSRGSSQPSFPQWGKILYSQSHQQSCILYHVKIKCVWSLWEVFIMQSKSTNWGCTVLANSPSGSHCMCNLGQGKLPCALVCQSVKWDNNWIYLIGCCKIKQTNENFSAKCTWQIPRMCLLLLSENISIIRAIEIICGFENVVLKNW